MRRAPFVIIGTALGVAGVLAYPTRHTQFVVPKQAASAGATTTAPTATPTTVPTTSPTAAGPGTTTRTGPATTPATTASGRKATGADEPYRYGDLAVQVTVVGSRITDVSMSQLNDGGGRSADIDQQAIPQLRQEVLAAQSTNINAVSGATYTSQAYVDSVQSALDQLGVK